MKCQNPAAQLQTIPSPYCLVSKAKQAEGQERKELFLFFSHLKLEPNTVSVARFWLKS
jgi:hypothetical protein